MSSLGKFIVSLFSRDDGIDRDVLKFEEELSPNMRALRLAMTIADYQMSMGITVADTVSTVLDVTDVYCKRAVQVDINSTVITLSQDRGDDREPLTILRHMTPRPTNYMQIQAINSLVRRVTRRELRLRQAEHELDRIVNAPRHYPAWLTLVGGGMISAGVGALLSGSPIIILITFLAGLVVSWFMHSINRRQMPAFFAQVLASTFITLVAGGVYALSRAELYPILDNVNPSLIVIGGIVQLLAGVAIVSAIGDAIDEFYVTATARLLKVLMMTIGVVAGILTGLYLLQQFGQPLMIDTHRPASDIISWQYIGALMTAVGYALSVQVAWRGLLFAAGIGAITWYTYASITTGVGLSQIVATGIAAFVASLCATFVSRLWHTPSSALITAGIIALVPGLALFNGLMLLLSGSTDPTVYDTGSQNLLRSLLVALAIATGASLGNLIGRPFSATVVRARNILPQYLPEGIQKK